MTGSAGQKRVPLNFLETAEIPLPDLSEQRRIAGELERADGLRRTRRYALELTDTFLPAAFLQLFGEPVAMFPACCASAAICYWKNSLLTFSNCSRVM
jgi:type I restriction enzyme S subunit